MNTESNKISDKRQCAKLTTLSMEAGTTNANDILTDMLEKFNQDELVSFLHKYTNSEDFKNNYDTIPECITKLKDSSNSSFKERKAPIKEVVNFLVKDCARKRTNDMINSEIGQMMFGWLFNGEECKEVNDNLENIPKDVLELKLPEGYSLDKPRKKKRGKPCNIPTETLITDEYIKEKCFSESPLRFKIPSQARLDMKREYLGLTDKKQFKYVPYKLTIKDIVKSLEFEDKEISQDVIDRTNLARNKKNGEVKLNIPWEYYPIVENNSKLYGISFKEYVQILATDAISRGTDIDEIISKNRSNLISNLNNKLIRINISGFGNTVIYFEEFKINEIDNRFVIVELTHKAVDFKYEFKYDLALGSYID